MRDKRYWQKDSGTDLDKYEDELQRKFEVYRTYVKEIESKFHISEEEIDEEDLEVSEEEIAFHLSDHQNTHKLRGKRRKLVADAQRNENYNVNTLGMS